MVLEKEQLAIPRTLAEFIDWEPEDGFKYEWNDGELIKFTGMNRKQIKIYDILLRLFIEKGYIQLGTFVAEYDVMLSGIQLRRPDITYLSKAQVIEADNGKDPIPEFAIEIISSNDQINNVEEKIIEYYKAGVKVVWLIFPEKKSVHVYTSRRDVKICIENDICSAKPVLDEFEIGVDVLLG
jgi:Uma2 family endonuclease